MTLQAQATHVTPDQYKKAHECYAVYGAAVCQALDREHPHLKFFLDPMVAVNVVVATYDDIDRFKAYHLRNRNGGAPERSDVVKRATYFAKWTTKLRPIMFTRKSKKYPQPDLGLLVNESFALSYAIELISAELKKDISLSEKTLADLQYDLHYRELGDDALMSIFQMIVDLARDGRPNKLIEFSIA